MSKTPRTDRFIRIAKKEGWKDARFCLEVVDLLRQLETELSDKDRQLAEARAEVERKNKLIEQMREALRAWVRTPDIPLHEAIKATEAALEAAEKVG